MEKIILITGGCGFIGSCLIAELLARQSVKTIRILDNLIVGTEGNLRKVTSFARTTAENCSEREGVVLIQGDIRCAETLSLCARGCDAIVHLAANTGVGPSIEDPRLDMECNVIGTLNVLEAAREHVVPRVVFASSGAPVGEVEPPIHEELAPHPVSPYGASKLAGEGYCSAYYRSFGVGTVCLRFGNVYGPRSGHKNSVVAKFIRQALNGEICRIYGDGAQTRDFIYIDDLVRALLLSLERPVEGEIFQIATGHERTVGEVAENISTVLQRHGIGMGLAHEARRAGDVQRNYSDTRKAERLLGWRSAIDFEDGIARTVGYFLEMQKT